MDNLVFRLSWNPDEADVPENLLSREWILTNGLGGYASGTLSGLPSRRYHGLLSAALNTPFGRQLFLNHLSELVILPDGSTAFLAVALKALGDPQTRHFRLREFRLEGGLPYWQYELGEYVIERYILMLHRQNTIHVSYKLLSGSPVQVYLRPSVHFRSHDEQPSVLDLTQSYSSIQRGERYEVQANDSKLPSLNLYVEAEEKGFVNDPAQVELLYREEKNRGYAFNGSLWTPGYFQTAIKLDKTATLIASTEPWEAALALTAEQALAADRNRRQRLIAIAAPEVQQHFAAQLVLAADQFVIAPIGRPADSARAHAIGEHSRSVIAGYHWFTDWGRDTMISLEGLTLVTGRISHARWILHTFASHLRNGLIPNLFPEGEREGLYHTADATLWFFNALSRYLDVSKDYESLRVLLPKLNDIIEWHIRGTAFGIGMDPNDKLIVQGAEGYQLTWMDAKVDDWIVTPRRGKAVEINALWYNALRLMQKWLNDENDLAKSEKMKTLADEVYISFNSRFWNEANGYLFDVVDGEDGKPDAACRPNQLFAIALRSPVLAEARWAQVVSIAEEKLLTPVGLRSLSREHPDYKASYNGDLRSRDAAYHQGTVWSWLIGPFIDAWLKVHPGQYAKAREFLNGFVPHLIEAGLGTISEVFDAEAPFTPRGCIAQAWGVAEILRCLRNTSLKSPADNNRLKQ